MAIATEQKLEISKKLGPALLFFWDIAAPKYNICTSSVRNDLVAAIAKYDDTWISEYSIYYKCVVRGMLYYQRNMVYGLTQAIGVPMDWQELIDPNTTIQLGAHFNTQAYSAYLSWIGRSTTITWP
eukprot:UN00214